jgi:hypothetical protein
MWRGLPALALALLLGAAPPAGAQVPSPAAEATLAAGAENPLVQRGVPAEATAETAVVARDRALASGQRIAYERLATAMGLQRDLSDAQIEGLVRSLIIESERITAGRYVARITVNFNPSRIRGGEALASPGGAPGIAPGALAAPAGAAIATVEATARYASFPEWLELNRRLRAAPQVARVDVVTVSGQMARLRLALRAEPGAAASELAAGGIAFAQPPAGTPPGEGWRLSLAGGR